MKKRTSIYFEDEDRRMMRFLRERYGLDGDASVVRFLVRKAAKEEGYVPSETGQHQAKVSGPRSSSWRHDTSHGDEV